MGGTSGIGALKINVALDLLGPNPDYYQLRRAVLLLNPKSDVEGEKSCLLELESQISEKQKHVYTGKISQDAYTITFLSLT